MLVKGIYAYIPNVIYRDLRREVAKNDSIELDKAVLIIYFIKQLKYRDKNVDGGKECVALNSAILQQYVRGYPRYLKFLEQEGFIECNKGYCEGHSRTYKIADKYFGLEQDIITLDLSKTFKNKKASKKAISKMVEAQAKNPELTKWLLGDLCKFTIDYQEAQAYTEVTYSGKDDDGYREKRLMDIEQLNNGDMFFSRDGKDNRFHSNFTSLAGDLKQFIKYDGMTLAEVDIKSSQPVIIATIFKQVVGILDKHYHTLPDISIRTDKDVDIFKNRIKNDIKEVIYNGIDSSKYSKAIKNTKDKYSSIKYVRGITIMLVKHVVTLDNTEFLAFKNNIYDFAKLVYQGGFYEAVGKQLFDAGIAQEVLDIDTGKLIYKVELYDKEVGYIRSVSKTSLRDIAKALVLNIIYLSGNYRSVDAINFFREQNPAVAKMLRIFMMDDNDDETGSFFPILIQHFEAKAMLDYCIKKLAKKHPKMPLVTIHDSVSTTLEYYEVLKKELPLLLADYYGFKVMTGMKLWSGEEGGNLESQSA